ncbi:acetate kinase [Methylobacterium aquaticum]|uniref:Acetate kinase n=1 Tax=Methylobacterium aquaticum TaxID=270351 RepID=A0A0C6F6E6_9HYPH|nr:acetate kinase [Methylobacterium aquaticum]
MMGMRSGAVDPGLVYRVVREAGSLVAALGGLGDPVFTAGIGEHAPRIRAAVAAGLAAFGIASTRPATRRPRRASAASARAWRSTWCRRTKELAVARAVARLLTESVTRGRCRDRPAGATRGGRAVDLRRR